MRILNPFAGCLLRLIPFLIAFLVSPVAFGQVCSFTQAQFESGTGGAGSGNEYAGNCTLTTTGDVNITAAIIITGGTIDFSGAGGFDEANVSTGSIQINSGATLDLLTTGNANLDIGVNGSVDVQTGGTITGGDDDNWTVNGTLNVAGTVTMGDVTSGDAGSDLTVSGATAHVTVSGTLTTGDDIKVINGGTFEVESGGTVNISGATGNLVNSTAGPGGGAGVSQGTVIVEGTLNVGGNVNFDDTGDPPNASQIQGSGDISVTGTFDVEDPGDSDFTGCSPGPCSGSGSLPVDLVSFSASQSQNSVQINWITSAEINNDFFSVERSKDGYYWNTLAVVAGSGNSNVLNQYAFTDNNPVFGQSYYRLKQTDYDGSSEYFGPLTINFSGQAGFAIHPNPTRDFLFLESHDIENAVLTIVSLSGQEIAVPLKKTSGNKASFDVSSLQRGLYILRIYDSGRLSNLRFVKL